MHVSQSSITAPVLWQNNSLGVASPHDGHSARVYGRREHTHQLAQARACIVLHNAPTTIRQSICMAAYDVAVVTTCCNMRPAWCRHSTWPRAAPLRKHSRAAVMLRIVPLPHDRRCPSSCSASPYPCAHCTPPQCLSPNSQFSCANFSCERQSVI
jgi:hypothetical protein